MALIGGANATDFVMNCTEKMRCARKKVVTLGKLDRIIESVSSLQVGSAKFDKKQGENYICATAGPLMGLHAS